MSKIKTLKDCCEFQEGYVNPSQKDTSFFGGNIKWLRASDLNGGHVYNTERTLSEKGFKSAGKSAKLFKRGTIAISKSGTIGALGILEDEMCGNRAVINISVDESKADLKYVFYTLKYKKEELVSKAGGSIQKNLYVSALETLSLNHSLIEEQHRISSVVSAIDDKIEINSRINSELGAMAKALYDYWFVQFDFPNANGKPYKTSGGKMVYSPTLNREIPEGWEILPLSSITRVSNESISPADYPEKLFKHFSIPVFDATNTFGVERGDTIGSNKFTVKDTDLLVSKLNPWFNRVIYAMGESEQICSTEFVVWRCSNASIKNFMYMIATSPQFITHCTQSATGTSNSHKRVNPNVMMRFEQPFNLYVAEKLGQHLEPILKQLIVNQRENTKLSSLRDWLLPMLMNGQVTVRVAS